MAGQVLGVDGGLFISNFQVWEKLMNSMGKIPKKEGKLACGCVSPIIFFSKATKIEI